MRCDLRRGLGRAFNSVGEQAGKWKADRTGRRGSFERRGRVPGEHSCRIRGLREPTKRGQVETCRETNRSVRTIGDLGWTCHIHPGGESSGADKIPGLESFLRVWKTIGRGIALLGRYLGSVSLYRRVARWKAGLPRPRPYW